MSMRALFETLSAQNNNSCIEHYKIHSKIMVTSVELFYEDISKNTRTAFPSIDNGLLFYILLLLTPLTLRFLCTLLLPRVGQKHPSSLR